ncbi:hypothetical protein P280DRAFT_545015 [Massarina eburnea CBS 473.64]|uniref:Chromatin assembly factor 1 subunit A n=1 Tax=Massarina eburnea CBS 473.64 TaxID=1395130 RepID=A0A6A6SJZ1_9PLEO|nr:hypothetical protein P280DRAFT_545015 [Massarina eburnea CBS 473.64]
MEAAAPVAALAGSQKRPFEDVAEPSTPNNRAISSASSTPLSILSVSTPSPLQRAPTAAAPTSASSSGAPAPTPTPAQSTPASSNAQSAKRRKLTAQEKEEQRVDKEVKAKARAEKKEQKEAEDKLKAQQKEEKNRAKELKKQQDEEEKRRKEEEKRKKEDEKQKKERSQMKLIAFFTKPKSTGDSSVKTTVDNIQTPATGPISLAPCTVVTNTNSAPPSPQKAIVKSAQSDYDRFFLPFSLPAHTILAPYNVFMEKRGARAAAKDRMNKLIAREEVESEPITMETLRSVFPKRRRGLNTATISEVVGLVNSSADDAIELTGEPNANQQKPLDMLKQIPMKYLRFPEDVRPPYYGTYTKLHESVEERKLARNPILRGLKDLNYDYDSEAEWEEPEEGEDLGSEGEEDLDEDGDEDMDGFLDDDDDPEIKRRLLSGDQEPVSSGLCWEDQDGVSILNDGSGAICTDFKEFRMGFLLEPQARSIDPFSTVYWAPEPTPAPVPMRPSMKDGAGNSSMNPPRFPLTSRPVNGLLNGSSSTPKTQVASGAKAVKTKRTIPAEQLPAFKAEVEGQDLTKIAMVEALKKRFPEFPKDAITNTLTLIAKREGKSEKEKRWTIVS